MSEEVNSMNILKLEIPGEKSAHEFYIQMSYNILLYGQPWYSHNLLFKLFFRGKGEEE